MTSPYDPNIPLYQGQALRTQAQPQPQPQQHQGQPVAPNAAGLHFLEGAGNLLLAGLHFFGGQDDEEEEIQQERPRFRSRFAPTRGPARAGSGSCCRRSAK